MDSDVQERSKILVQSQYGGLMATSIQTLDYHNVEYLISVTGLVFCLCVRCHCHGGE